LSVHILETYQWCLVLSGKGNHQIQEKTIYHQPVNHPKWSVITEEEEKKKKKKKKDIDMTIHVFWDVVP
jgi:hypothetical protein